MEKLYLVQKLTSVRGADSRHVSAIVEAWRVCAVGFYVTVIKSVIRTFIEFWS